MCAKPIRASAWSKAKCGTIVETLDQPYPAYLVESVDDAGFTKAEGAFTPDQLSATPPPP